MSVDPYEEKLWDSELFGKPVLSTSRLIAQGTAPEGWYRYDLQASGEKTRCWCRLSGCTVPIEVKAWRNKRTAGANSLYGRLR